MPLDDGSGTAHPTPDNLSISALPWRAYTLIWNEWFRDQNLQDSIVWNPDDGPDGPNTSGTDVASHPLKRGKRHDYFTSCLPSPQKGDAATLPITGTPYVHGDATALGVAYSIYNDRTAGYTQLDASTSTVADTATAGLETNVLFADLDGSVNLTVNDLRLAFQTQRLLERDARSGTRYVETILAHFGVTVPDFRVQRPEFLGGGSSPVNISVCRWMMALGQRMWTRII